MKEKFLILMILAIISALVLIRFRARTGNGLCLTRPKTILRVSGTTLSEQFHLEIGEMERSFPSMPCCWIGSRASLQGFVN